MSISNIHDFVDAETLTDTKLNSIKAALTAVLGVGAIPSSSLSWPIVAQGNLDMNGYSLSNSGLFFGQTYVNADKTLASAIADTVSAGGGTIVIEAGFTATAADIDLNNGLVAQVPVHIVGDGTTSTINIPSSITNYGLSYGAYNYHSSISGIKFTGGIAGKPAVQLDATRYFNFQRNNTQDNYIGDLVGTTNNENSFCLFAHNNILNLSGTDATAFHMTSLAYSRITDNVIAAAYGYGVWADSPSGAARFRRNVISNNVINGMGTGVGTGTCIHLEDSGGTNYYENIIANNVTANSGNGTKDITIANLDDSVVTGNSAMYGIDITMDRGTFQGNIMKGSLWHQCTDTTTVGNYVGGAVAATSGQDGIFNNNFVVGNATMNFGPEVMVGNSFDGTTTGITNMANSVYGLNRGY